MQRWWTLVLTLFTLLTGSIVVSSCRTESTVAEKSRQRSLALMREHAAPAPGPSPATVIEEQRVYLDASLSMKGFAQSPRSSAFHELLDAIGDVMPNCRLYRYGQRGSTAPQDFGALVEPASFGLELHRPEFYNLSFNPDDRLIENLAREERPVLSVLITDGVYSEQGGSTAPPVVQAIEKWMEGGRAFGILSFDSPFSGPFYSERTRRFLPALNVEARPFYAFVFSPTEKAFRDLEGQLKHRFPAARVILFSDSAVSCSVSLPEKVKGLYSVAKPPNAPYQWQMFDEQLLAQGNPAVLRYGVKCESVEDYPAADFNPEVSADYYRWQRDDFNGAGGTPNGYKAEVEPTGPGQHNLVINFPRDSGADYGFYHMKVSTEMEGLRPEILERSTRDDSQPENANKTFRFYEIVDTLTRQHFKTRLAPKLVSSFFVTIANH